MSERQDRVVYVCGCGERTSSWHEATCSFCGVACIPYNIDAMQRAVESRPIPAEVVELLEKWRARYKTADFAATFNLELDEDDVAVGLKDAADELAAAIAKHGEGSE